MGLSDPSVLLATSVQSGAALVGIVGGLIASRYVALDADQQSALRGATEIAGRLELAIAEQEKAESAWVEFMVADCLDRNEVYDALARANPPLDLDDVLSVASVDAREVPREALVRRLRLIEGEFREALRTLAERVPKREQIDGWSTFCRENRLEPKHDGVWEWVYRVVAEQRQEEAREEKRKREFENSSWFNLGRSYEDWAQSRPVDPTTFLRPSPLDDLIAIGEPRHVTLARLSEDREDARRTVSRLEAEEEVAVAHVNASRQPEGFHLALWVLLFLAVTTMAYPTVLMVWGPENPGTWWLASVAALFIVGVGLLMRYLFVYASVLSTRSIRRRMPRSPLGLLVPYRLSRAARESL